MLFGIPAGELVLLVAALIVAGLVAGFLAGLLGIGGGGVLVPVLYEVFRILDVDPAIRMHMVLGTTLAIIAPTSLKSFAGHRAKGSVDLALLEARRAVDRARRRRRHPHRQSLERHVPQMGVGDLGRSRLAQDGAGARGLAHLR